MAKQYSKADFKILRRKARYMFIYEGLTMKAISDQIGVSENTLSKWRKAYFWQSAHIIKESKDLSMDNKPLITGLEELNNFRRFIETEYPMLKTTINQALNNYLFYRK